MSKILLITVNYPFGYGEHFIGCEIEHLAKKNQEISLMPHYFSGKARIIPDGVKVEGASKRQYWFTLLVGVFYSLFKYRKYYITDLLATIRAEKFKVLRLSRLLYILGYLVRSCRFIAWIDLFYKQDLEDILLYTYWMNAEAYGVSILKRKNPRFKTVSRVHGGDLYKERNSGFLPFRSPIVNTLDRIFPISNQGKNYLIQEYGEHLSNKIHVSRLGVSKFEQLPNRNKRSGVTIASCSSDDPVKRVKTILEAIGYFSNTVSERVVWVHIGIDKNLFYKKYKHLLQLYNNLDCVVQGIVPNRQVRDIYGRYQPNLFVNLSASEGVPVSIMEALSCGIPVVATDVGGTSEIVDNSVGALVSSEINIDSIKSEFERVTKFGDEYSSSAYQRWNDLCNENQNYAKYYQNLKEVQND